MNCPYDIKELLNYNPENKKRSIVFCETLFHLFNTICIFRNYSNHAPVDIVLTDSSDFSKAKEILEKEGPFENVYTINVKEKIKQLWQGTKPEEREQIALDAGSYLPEIDLKHTYTDLWTNIDSMASKMFYYKLVKYGMTPSVHFIEEGTSSYVLDLSASEKDFIEHNKIYKKRSFVKNIADMWLHEPRIYSGSAKKYPIYQIPNTILKNPDTKELLLKIFGSCELPSEKFIFFEESFVADSRTTNDFDLFLEIANIVGKENIIVKRHPRNPVNRFEQLGFKVMEQQNIPWEILLLNNDISGKVLISIGSSATLTPFLLYGMRPKAFLLRRLLCGKVPYLDNPKMYDFFSKSAALFNQNSLNLYYPTCIKELQLAIQYLNDVESAEDNLTPLFDTSDSYLYDPFYSDNAEEIAEEIAEEEITYKEENIVTYEQKLEVIEKKLAQLKPPYMSIVVPVYNVEKYLRRCLNSIVFQTVEDIEIIVVNDGSTDNSQEIIDEYATLFPKKIVALKKENGGLSSAREFGLKHAKGKYVGFVDSDDYLDCNYCKKCLEALLYDDTKAVAFCVNHVYTNGQIVAGKVPRDDSMQSLILDMAASFWSKVYDREYLTENAQFLNMWYEDIPVINPMLSHLDKISILKDRLYFYLRDRDDSITNKATDIRQLDALVAEKMAIENTHPKYRDYQIARSISRLATMNIDAFCDQIYQFITAYSEDLLRDEVRNLIQPYALNKIDIILNQNYKNIPANIFIPAFDKTPEEKLSLKEKYSSKVLWGEENIVIIDENNCDITENAVIKMLYDNKEYRKLSAYYSAKFIYENGGIALNDNFIFNSTLNKFTYSDAFFSFAAEKSISDAIFGAKKGCKIIENACNRFLNYNGELSIAECIEYYLVGEYGAILLDRTQALSGIEILCSKFLIHRIDNQNITVLSSLCDEEFIKTPVSEYFNHIDYISKKLVPVETLRSANKRATKYQNSSAKRLDRIYSLKEKISLLKEQKAIKTEKISELKAQKTELKSQIKEFKFQNKDLKAQNKELKVQNKELKAEIKAFKAKNKWLEKRSKILKRFPFNILLKGYKFLSKIIRRIKK